MKNPQDEKCTHEPRTDPNDQRPRLAVAWAVRSQRLARLSHHHVKRESFTACDITRPFSGKIGRGMITVSTPTD